MPTTEFIVAKAIQKLDNLYYENKSYHADNAWFMWFCISVLFSPVVSLFLTNNFSRNLYCFVWVSIILFLTTSQLIYQWYQYQIGQRYVKRFDNLNDLQKEQVYKHLESTILKFRDVFVVDDTEAWIVWNCIENYLNKH